MDFWSCLVLGLTTSVHCVAMCGMRMVLGRLDVR